MNRIVETLVPARLGTGLRWLIASSSTSNLGDGIAFVGSALFVVAIWRQLAHIAHADGQAPAPS